jgi:hypothetical protein
MWWQSAPCATLAVDERNDQIHNGGRDEHFDQVVIELLQHQLPKRCACAACRSHQMHLLIRYDQDRVQQSCLKYDMQVHRDRQAARWSRGARGPA